MIKEFSERWFENKDELKEYISTHEQSEYNSYKELVKLVIRFIINKDQYDYYSYSVEDLVEIDNGDCQGSLVFITHRETYQPAPDDYIQTYVWYGSCSGCDTLLGINGDGFDMYIPNEQQVEDYMTLCLHILQRFKYTFNEEELDYD